jgi:hypothetical protein
MDIITRGYRLMLDHYRRVVEMDCASITLLSYAAENVGGYVPVLDTNGNLVTISRGWALIEMVDNESVFPVLEIVLGKWDDDDIELTAALVNQAQFVALCNPGLQTQNPATTGAIIRLQGNLLDAPISAPFNYARPINYVGGPSGIWTVPS